MSIQRIEPGKRLLAPFTRKRTVIRVQLFMSLAIVLPRKAFPASWPLALEGLLVHVRSLVAYMTKYIRSISFIGSVNQNVDGDGNTSAREDGVVCAED